MKLTEKQKWIRNINILATAALVFMLSSCSVKKHIVENKDITEQVKTTETKDSSLIKIDTKIDVVKKDNGIITTETKTIKTFKVDTINFDEPTIVPDQEIIEEKKTEQKDEFESDNSITSFKEINVYELLEDDKIITDKTTTEETVKKSTKTGWIFWLTICGAVIAGYAVYKNFKMV